MGKQEPSAHRGRGVLHERQLLLGAHQLALDNGPAEPKQLLQLRRQAALLDAKRFSISDSSSCWVLHPTACSPAQA